jgi:hypothetical protein
MSRLFAAVLFLFGGVAAELRQPVHCTMLHARRVSTDRRRS